MDMADRIKLVMQSRNLSAGDFAQIIGVQRSAISHLLSGRNKPSIGVVESILNSFPQVDAKWLITGKSQERTEVEQDTDQEAIGEKSANASGFVTDVTNQVAPPISPTRATGKRIIRVVLLLEDGTFESFENKVQ